MLIAFLFEAHIQHSSRDKGYGYTDTLILTKLGFDTSWIRNK